MKKENIALILLCLFLIALTIIVDLRKKPTNVQPLTTTKEVEQIIYTPTETTTKVIKTTTTTTKKPTDAQKYNNKKGKYYYSSNGKKR